MICIKCYVAHDKAQMKKVKEFLKTQKRTLRIIVANEYEVGHGQVSLYTHIMSAEETALSDNVTSLAIVVEVEKKVEKSIDPERVRNKLLQESALAHSIAFDIYIPSTLHREPHVTHYAR